MTERYDATAARHYAAFRPPLHPRILERLLRPAESFTVGLDVGCGTGHSAVALAAYCHRVIGIDANRPMLEAALAHPAVTYLEGSAETLDRLAVPPCEVVSFAGSLFYAKSDALRGPLCQVCSPEGTILVYDFEVILTPILSRLGIPPLSALTTYDHQTGLTDWPEFVLLHRGADQLRLTVSPRELAHLILADSNRCDLLRRRFTHDDPFGSLASHLEGEGDAFHLKANTFFSRYRVHGGR